MINEKDYMYYLSDYEDKINIDNFTNFVGNSKIITIDDINDQILKNFNIEKIDVDLKNEINKYKCHRIVKCTILGRYIYKSKFKFYILYYLKIFDKFYIRPYLTPMLFRQSLLQNGSFLCSYNL